MSEVERDANGYPMPPLPDMAPGEAAFHKFDGTYPDGRRPSVPDSGQALPPLLEVDFENRLYHRERWKCLAPLSGSPPLGFCSSQP